LQKNCIEAIQYERFLSSLEKENETKKEKKIAIAKEITERIFSLDYKCKLTCEVFTELAGDIRNDINHAGFRTKPLNANKFEKKLNEYYNKVMEIFNVN
jgi:hypothetical protein